MLDRLPVAKGASFDSRAEEHNSTCLENTRHELLDQISKWVDDPNGKAIFWLNGMAGTGKSTISRTFARSQSAKGHLGASFFFKRGELDQGTLSKFMTTIAWQLIQRQPSLAPILKEAIDADPAVLQSAVQDQFAKLIFNPLLKTAQNVPILLIIDALDECDDERDIRLLIRSFSRIQSLQSSWFRVFITSRPELPIRLGFKTVEGTYQNVVLHEMPPQTIERDISAFLQHELRKVRNEYNESKEGGQRLPPEWPVHSDIMSLVDMAIPLFIFAATACRFISERRCGNPSMQLNRLLEYKGTSANSGLDKTYLPILEQQIFDLSPQSRDEVVKQFRRIVGGIIVLASPLPVTALVQLLGVSQETIEVRLDQLHSVLDVPSSQKLPVRPFHLSFRDFLTDPATCNKTPLWIDEKRVHRSIAERCFYIMDRSLQMDICDVRNPGTPRRTLPPEKMETRLPLELRYCCLNWVHHLQQAGVQVLDAERIYDFLTNHFLHWLEALSLMGRISQSLSLLRTLHSLVEVC